MRSADQGLCFLLEVGLGRSGSDFGFEQVEFNVVLFKNALLSGLLLSVPACLALVFWKDLQLVELAQL